ncbi:MAG: zinc-dependent metalloprotease, partial [Bacteroidota bacterium]
GNGINFDTDPAKQTFQRALNTWKEIVGANIIEGGTTTVQAVAFDGVNTIMYDNQNTGMAPLASGVLAVCLNWFSGCPGNASGQARKREFEVIVYNPAVSSGTPTFTNGPCPPNSTNVNALDLETVILHELGHALNLGHVIDGYQGSIIGRLNPNKLMNYALVNSVRRNTPDYSAKAGALYTITPQGSISGACTFSPEMTPLTVTTESKDECPASFPVTPTSPGTVVSFDLVHASSTRFVDPAYTQIRCGSSNGAAITNNAYYVFRTSASGLLSMTVSGFNTTPAALASCPSVLGGGQPATGIRLVIYQVSSCPAAGSFPTPFACRTISGDGALADVMGLAANTSYLMYLEGIENTKASFSIAMGGTSLPIRFESFSGTVINDYNKLNWVIDYSYNVKELILEKSSNGSDYFAIDSTDGNYLLPKDFYNDTRPFTGKNFYRLAVINTDGSKQYSDVVLLVRNDKFLASVYPNPASSTLNIEINTVNNGKYNLELYTATGQLVRKQAYEIVAPRQIIHLPVSNMASGSYFLKISNDKNETLQNTTVQVNR